MLDPALVTKYVDAGTTAWKEQRPVVARRNWLLASESLYSLAAASQGQTRRLRITQAQELAERALRIPLDIDSTTAAPRITERIDDDATKRAWAAQTRPAIRLDDAAGMEQAKEELYRRVVYPVLYPEPTRRFRKHAGGGILLYGPPGCGKTLLGRAAAGELDCNFFCVRPSDVMSKFFGDAERNLRALFEAAHQARRSIIFLDEFDGFAPQRRSTNSSVMPRVVAQLLTEMQGFHQPPEGSLLLVLAATNEPWSVDGAFLRPGRFDVLIYVGLPDAVARLAILHRRLDGIPCAADVDLAATAEQTPGYSGADIVALCDKITDYAYEREIRGRAPARVEADDVTRALAEITPSVSSSEVARFDRYRAERTRRSTPAY